MIVLVQISYLYDSNRLFLRFTIIYFRSFVCRHQFFAHPIKFGFKDALRQSARYY